MDYAKICSAELEKVVRGIKRYENVYFNLEGIKVLPMIINHLNYIDDVVITPYHITDNSVIELYWCSLSIKVVDEVQDKNLVLLHETGKSSLKEIDKEIIEQWDNTYFEVLKEDIKGFTTCFNQYIYYMSNRESSLREEFDMPQKKSQGIYYEIF